jgi:hypothetical protein
MYRRSAVNRRPLVAGALAAVAVTTTGLLSACSAGQLAQTAAIRPGVAGVNAQAPGRLVFVRNAALDFPGKDGYKKGDNAPLSVWIFNDTETPITLVRVFGPTVVESDGANAAEPCSVPRSTPPVAPSTVTPANGTASPSPSKPSSAPAKSAPSTKASPSPSESSAAPSPSPSPSVGSEVNVKIPAGGCVELSKRAANYLQIVGLPKDIGNGDTVPVLFAFIGGDGSNFTVGTPDAPVMLPVATPDSPQPRSS